MAEIDDEKEHWRLPGAEIKRSEVCIQVRFIAGTLRNMVELFLDADAKTIIKINFNSEKRFESERPQEFIDHAATKCRQERRGCDL